MTNPPLAAMALLADPPVPAPPIDPIERRLLALETRVIGLTRTVEALADKQDATNDEIRECLDRVYNVLDQTEEGERE